MPRPSRRGAAAASSSIRRQTQAAGSGRDTGYRSKKNEALLKDRMLESHIHRKKPRGRPMPSTRRPCQRQAVGDPAADRAHLRLPEGQDGPVHPHDRPRPRQDEDRLGQPRLQHEAIDLACAHCRSRLTGQAPRRAPHPIPSRFRRGRHRTVNTINADKSSAALSGIPR